MDYAGQTSGLKRTKSVRFLHKINDRLFTGSNAAIFPLHNFHVLINGTKRKLKGQYHWISACHIIHFTTISICFFFLHLCDRAVRAQREWIETIMKVGAIGSRTAVGVHGCTFSDFTELHLCVLFSQSVHSVCHSFSLEIKGAAVFTV